MAIDTELGVRLTAMPAWHFYGCETIRSGGHAGCTCPEAGGPYDRKMFRFCGECRALLRIDVQHECPARASAAETRETVERLQEERNAALRRAERAEAALRRYGAHTEGCVSDVCGPDTCDCGLDAALRPEVIE